MNETDFLRYFNEDVTKVMTSICSFLILRTSSQPSIQTAASS